jgi:hypothetical protein
MNNIKKLGVDDWFKDKIDVTQNLILIEFAKVFDRSQQLFAQFRK